MSTSKTFLTDICRTLGCDSDRVCGRCGEVNVPAFIKLVEEVLSTVDLDYRMDDLDQIEVLMACEEHYDIEILDEEIEKLMTPRDFLTYVRKRMYAQKEQV